jgi:hypothetical protein
METNHTEGDIHAHYYGTCSGERARSVQSVLAERILKAAAKGERDPDRLRVRALMNDCAAMKVAS